MPVLVAGRAPDDVAGPDLDDGFALALGPATAGGDDEGLTQGVGMPIGAGARLKGDAGAGDPSGRRRIIQRVEADRTGEILCRRRL
jgi:hypothetical protein